MSVDVIVVEPLTNRSRSTPEVECWTCGLHVEMLPDLDLHACLQRFRAAHPMTAGLPHIRLIPDGWRVPLSAPGALSQ